MMSQFALKLQKVDKGDGARRMSPNADCQLRGLKIQLGTIFSVITNPVSFFRNLSDLQYTIQKTTHYR